MKVIKDIVHRIQEELEDAEGYAWSAIKCKTDHPTLAEVYHRLSLAEIDHSIMLHKEAVSIIDKYRQGGHESPVEMKAIWDWEHEKFMGNLAEVRRLVELYKDS